MYSDFFDMSAPAYYELYCMNSSNPELKKFFRVKISIQEEVHYLQITEIEKEKLTRLIKNSTQLQIEVRSAQSKQEPIQIVKPGESLYYAQCYPKSSTSLLQVSVEDKDGKLCSKSIDLMIIKPEPIFYEFGHQSLLLRSTVTFVGANTVLELSTVSRDNFKSSSRLHEAFKNIILFSINAVSISFMRLPENKPRQELLNMVISNLTGFVQIIGNSEITFDGSIENIQIDNNSVENTNFPVVLKKAFNPSEDRLPIVNRTFCKWHIVVENPVKSSHWYFSDINVNLSKMEVFIEEEYVDSLLHYKNNLLKAINVKSKLGVKECIVFKYYTDFLKLPQDHDISKRVWEVSELVPKDNFVFVESINVSSIGIELSYFQDAKTTIDKDFEMFSLIGVIIGGFEEAQISLKMIQQE